jgi:plastocyanin
MKHRIALLLTLAVATAAALTLAGTGTAAKQTVKAQTMTVLMYDFRFKLSKPSLKVGKVTILLKNKGHSIHNFVVTGVKSSPFLAPGTQKTYTITFKKKGKFNYVCTVPRHAELGMNGVLVVK